MNLLKENPNPIAIVAHYELHIHAADRVQRTSICDVRRCLIVKYTPVNSYSLFTLVKIFSHYSTIKKANATLEFTFTLLFYTHIQYTHRYKV